MLPEVHEHHRYHRKIANKGYWTYDFALPMLVLHTLYHHTSERLRNWLRICPRKQITTWTPTTASGGGCGGPAGPGRDRAHPQRSG
jgi:hypothetical protein